jgi:branched-subunit amino acid aminotransferase/4-amino-4-deoxychorismate lyase
VREASLGEAVFLNDRMTPASRARVSAFDRGFLYGDGLFETFRCYRGNPFALAQHLVRLRRSARWLRLSVPSIDWRLQVRRLLKRNRLEQRDAAVRLTLTRGVARPGLLPPRSSRPTVLITALPIDRSIDRAQRYGAPVILVPEMRSGVLAHHKLLGYVHAILARIAARRAHAFEALFVDGRGRLSEGTTSNLFFVERGKLLTPPLDDAVGILPGVTRQLVLELARAAAIPVGERRLNVDRLLGSEEAFCTSSVIEIVPVVRIGRRRIAAGHPGPITRRLQLAYREITP